MANLIEIDGNSNKDNLMNVIPQLIARKQAKARTAVMNAILRQIEFLPERFVGSYNIELLPEKLRTALADIAQLQGQVYNELNLKAKQLHIPQARTRPS